MNNVILIGMPGAGKSTVGRYLAKALNMPFVDTDHLLEQHMRMPIQSIVNLRGVHYFRRLEEQLLTRIDLHNHVIATGGSAVYSKASMTYMASLGIRVYLKISLATLMRRVNNVQSRGLVKMRAYPLPRLYAERIKLYNDAADVEFDNNGIMSAMTIAPLAAHLKENLQSGQVNII